MPLLYPDVIKLDLQLLAERDPARRRARRDRGRRGGRAPARDRARRGHRLRGRSSRWRAPRARRSARASCSASPGRCPTGSRCRGARCGWRVRAETRQGRCPSQRVTNWKRPVRGPLALAERAAALLTAQAAALGPTGMLLAAPDRSHASDALRGAARRARLRRRAARPVPRRHVDRGRARPGLRRVLRGAPGRGRRVARSRRPTTASWSSSARCCSWRGCRSVATSRSPSRPARPARPAASRPRSSETRRAFGIASA